MSSSKVELLMFDLNLRLHGYSNTGASISYNDNLSQIAQLLNDTPPITNFTNAHYSQKEVLSTARRIMKKYFELHHIRTLSEAKAIEIGKKYNSCSKALLSDLLQDLSKKSILNSPLSLPVTFIPGHSMIGNTKKSKLLIADDYFLQNAPITFSNILLGNNTTSISVGTYCHEITHTQVESQKGSTKEYTNKEVLPILIEKIIAFELDKSEKTLDISQKARFKHIANIINELKQQPNQIITPDNLNDFEQGIYLPGTLQALRLFDIYKDGSENIRNEMIANIQKVFDGHITVEDLLSFYNVTYENSQDISLVKKHLK